MKKLALAGAAMWVAALTPIDEAEATSCHEFGGELIDLQFESVTVDGVDVDQSTAYAPYTAYMTAGEGDDFFEFILTSSNGYWREVYQ